MSLSATGPSLQEPQSFPNEIENTFPQYFISVYFPSAGEQLETDLFVFG